MDDRMVTEDQKVLAENLMGQHPDADGSVVAVAEAVGTDHADKAAVMEMFGGITPNAAVVPQSAAPGLDLSALLEVESAPVPGAIREDLVQQAAQALVKDGTDAFLAITHRMTPDEVGVTLKTARTWRRSDPEWQNNFRSAPETGFKFIDRKKKNRAESLAVSIAEFMRSNRLEAALTPNVVRRVLRERKIQISEQNFVLFASRIAQML